MCRLSSLIFLLLGSVASFGAAACHRISPDPNSLKGYSAFFLGTVTGIHLEGYERRLLGKSDGSIGDQTFTLTDGSSPVSVTAVATKAVRGTPKLPIVVQLVGCTTSLPALKERGVFFVHSDGTSAITVWESSRQEFAHWLKKLGIKPDGR